MSEWKGGIKEVRKGERTDGRTKFGAALRFLISFSVSELVK